MQRALSLCLHACAWVLCVASLKTPRDWRHVAPFPFFSFHVPSEYLPGSHDCPMTSRVADESQGLCLCLQEAAKLQLDSKYDLNIEVNK